MSTARDLIILNVIEKYIFMVQNINMFTTITN